MKRLGLLALSFSLLLAAGCLASTREQWAEAMKDLRGDNMEMRSFGSKPRP